MTDKNPDDNEDRGDDWRDIDLGAGEPVPRNTDGGEPPAEAVNPDIAELNESYALVLAGDVTAIMKFEAGSDFRLMKVSAFRQWFVNKRVRLDDRLVPIGDLWLKHPQRRQYEGIEFAPGGGRSGYFNLWRGFAVEPREGDCSKFLAHIKDNVCSGNDDLYRWVMGWFAQIFQYPDEKVGTSLVLRGKQGVGKTKVAEVIGSLIGPLHYALVSNARYVTGKFNSHMASLLLLAADEAFWAGDKQAEGVLKDLVTGDEHYIEFKGKDPIQVANYIRLLVIGNQDWLVPAGFEERRFATLDVGEAHIEDIPYFAAIDQEMNNGGREALLYYLLNFDLSTVNLRIIPKTAALLDQKIASATPEQSWWLDVLQEGELPGGTDDPSICVKRLLFGDYLKHAKQQGVARRQIETTIGVFLKKYVGPDLTSDRKVSYDAWVNGRKVKRRDWAYRFPTLAECRKRFADEMRQEIVWTAEGDWQCGDEGPADGDEIPF